MLAKAVASQILGALKVTDHHVALAKGFLVNCPDQIIENTQWK